MVHMVNQITLFFQAYPHDEAVAGVANHIKLFWEPRMKRQLFDYAEAGGEGLLPLSLEAVQNLAASAAQAPGRVAGSFGEA